MIPPAFPEIPARVLAECQRSTEFCERIAEMTAQRTRVYNDLRDEHRRVSELLALAAADVRAIAQIAAREIIKQRDEIAELVILAMQTGRDDTAAEGARMLAHTVARLYNEVPA